MAVTVETGDFGKSKYSGNPIKTKITITKKTSGVKRSNNSSGGGGNSNTGYQGVVQGKYYTNLTEQEILSNKLNSNTKAVYNEAQTEVRNKNVAYNDARTEAVQKAKRGEELTVKDTFALYGNKDRQLDLSQQESNLRSVDTYNQQVKESQRLQKEYEAELAEAKQQSEQRTTYNQGEGLSKQEEFIAKRAEGIIEKEQSIAAQRNQLYESYGMEGLLPMEGDSFAKRFVKRVGQAGVDYTVGLPISTQGLILFGDKAGFYLQAAGASLVDKNVRKDFVQSAYKDQTIGTAKLFTQPETLADVFVGAGIIGGINAATRSGVSVANINRGIMSSKSAAAFKGGRRVSPKSKVQMRKESRNQYYNPNKSVYGAGTLEKTGRARASRFQEQLMKTQDGNAVVRQTITTKGQRSGAGRPTAQSIRDIDLNTGKTISYQQTISLNKGKANTPRSNQYVRPASQVQNIQLGKGTQGVQLTRLKGTQFKNLKRQPVPNKNQLVDNKYLRIEQRPVAQQVVTQKAPLYQQKSRPILNKRQARLAATKERIRKQYEARQRKASESKVQNFQTDVDISNMFATPKIKSSKPITQKTSKPVTRDFQTNVDISAMFKDTAVKAPKPKRAPKPKLDPTQVLKRKLVTAEVLKKNREVIKKFNARRRKISESGRQDFQTNVDISKMFKQQEKSIPKPQATRSKLAPTADQVTRDLRPRYELQRRNVESLSVVPTLVTSNISASSQTRDNVFAIDTSQDRPQQVDQPKLNIQSNDNAQVLVPTQDVVQLNDVALATGFTQDSSNKQSSDQLFVPDTTQSVAPPIQQIVPRSPLQRPSTIPTLRQSYRKSFMIKQIYNVSPRSTRTGGKRFQPKVPPIRTPKLFKRDSESEEDVAFTPLVKFGKVFKPISAARYKTKSQALAVAQAYVQRTPKATATTGMVKGKANAISKAKVNYKDFYVNKKGQYVEKSSARINTPGELKGITYKGIFARRKK